MAKVPDNITIKIAVEVEVKVRCSCGDFWLDDVMMSISWGEEHHSWLVCSDYGEVISDKLWFN